MQTSDPNYQLDWYLFLIPDLCSVQHAYHLDLVCVPPFERHRLLTSASYEL
jgi:hypothetical protein